MKALSLWQPWASCIAVGAKRNETRGKRTHHRGLLAIHAAKKWSRELAGTAEDFVRRHHVPLPGVYAWRGSRERHQLERPLPLGAVVAVATLADCVRMTTEWIEQQTDLERALGNYQPGRWGWVLEDVRPLAKPLPLKGRQSLWKLPDETARTIASRLEGSPGICCDCGCLTTWRMTCQCYDTRCDPRFPGAGCPNGAPCCARCGNGDSAP